ncbi:MAG: hypothetical protein ACLTKG_04125 [Collinsella intestinalis]
MTRIAIVTGASSGLGREFVKQLDAGAAGKLDEIWVVARRADRLEALRRTCDTPVRPFCLDLTDPASFDVIDGALSEPRPPKSHCSSTMRALERLGRSPRKGPRTGQAWQSCSWSPQSS